MSAADTTPRGVDTVEATSPEDTLLRERGRSFTWDAFVVACAFDPGGRFAAWGLGDGTVRLLTVGEKNDPLTLPAHEGAVLALAPDCTEGGVLAGGDDGRLARVSPSAVEEIATWPGRWVEHVLAWPGKSPWRAASVGKTVHVFDAAGARRKSLDHPSTVTGLASDGRGMRIAASHYGGASLWFAAAKEDRPLRLAWKGSHIGIAVSRDARFVVTAMQENALHGWRIEDGAHMRMTGYLGKTKSLSFSADGRWLATSGAESIVCWPFDQAGPMGRAPLELAGGDMVTVTHVACHPEHAVVAAGYADSLVLLVEFASGTVLPVAGPGRGPVSALAWSPDGRWLAWGTETGFAALVDFAPR